MDGTYYDAYKYRLRSAGLTPTGRGEFIIQTFGVDKNKIRLWPATTTLPKSDDFAGASFDGEFISASFQRLPFLSQNNQEVFSGQVVYKTEFIDESEMPGGGL